MNTAELTRGESEDQRLVRAPEAPAQAPPDVEHLLALQRSVGNAGVSRMLHRAPGERPLSRHEAVEDDAVLGRSLARAAAQRGGARGLNPIEEAPIEAPAPELEAEELESEAETGEAAPREGERSLARWPRIPFVSTPTIASQTTLTAPGNTDNTRTTVAVGEQVTFTGSSSGKWTASGGTPATGAKSKSFVWTAPDRAASVTIGLSMFGGHATKTMTVLEPSTVSGTKTSDLTFTAGQQGAGMTLRFTYGPATVSFGRVEVKEVSGPASNVTGYHAALPAADLWHDSGDRFYGVLNNNDDSVEDTASFKGETKPWTAGTYDWAIPYHFKTATESGGGKQFATVLQEHKMEGPPHAGRSTVKKAGAATVRSP